MMEDKKTVSIIVAVSENGVIGRSGDIPWKLKRDLRRFRDITVGSTVIMGRKTYESLDVKPLPRRQNVIITRNLSYEAPGCMIATSLDDALQKAESPNIFIIGGASLYNEALSRADRIYLTRVHTVVLGDTFFPDVNFSEWDTFENTPYPSDRENMFPTTFIHFVRKPLSPQAI